MIEVIVGDPAWRRALPQAGALALAAASATLATWPQAHGDIAIRLTTDAEVKSLNARFRGQDKPTNVLSFPAGRSSDGRLGDLALAFGVCAAEAEAQGKPLAGHLQHLVVHGVLHLAGFDHEAAADAERMEALERRILASLGVPDPYAVEGAEPVRGA
ncbi:MAG TPA: rRNA maturation RNase YbeY [Caulobacteraceae bacterium]|nr:rRNA maturation RNase YbeY [Caulobacteraceae bacterium]